MHSKLEKEKEETKHMIEEIRRETISSMKKTYNEEIESVSEDEYLEQDNR